MPCAGNAPLSSQTGEISGDAAGGIGFEVGDGGEVDLEAENLAIRRMSANGMPRPCASHG